MASGNYQTNFPIGADDFETFSTSDSHSHNQVNRIQERLQETQTYITDQDKIGIIETSEPIGFYEFNTPFPSGGGAWPSGESCPSGPEPFYGELEVSLTTQKSTGGTFYSPHLWNTPTMDGFYYTLCDFNGNPTSSVNGTVRLHFRAHIVQERP